MQKHKFPYNWRLSEAKFTKDKGKVFSCFACGGGSTMGYKLAGERERATARSLQFGYFGRFSPMLHLLHCRKS